MSKIEIKVGRYRVVTEPGNMSSLLRVYREEETGGSQGVNVDPHEDITIGAVFAMVNEIATLRSTLSLFREFTIKNANRWNMGCGHHHPAWQMVAEALIGTPDEPSSGPRYEFVHATNKESLGELHARAKNHAERLDWDGEAQATDDAYRTLTEPRDAVEEVSAQRNREARIAAATETGQSVTFLIPANVGDHVMFRIDTVDKEFLGRIEAMHGPNAIIGVTHGTLDMMLRTTSKPEMLDTHKLLEEVAKTPRPSPVSLNLLPVGRRGLALTVVRLAIR